MNILKNELSKISNEDDVVELPSLEEELEITQLHNELSLLQHDTVISAESSTATLVAGIYNITPKEVEQITSMDTVSKEATVKDGIKKLIEITKKYIVKLLKFIKRVSVTILKKIGVIKKTLLDKLDDSFDYKTMNDENSFYTGLRISLEDAVYENITYLDDENTDIVKYLDKLQTMTDNEKQICESLVSKKEAERLLDVFNISKNGKLKLSKVISGPSNVLDRLDDIIVSLHKMNYIGEIRDIDLSGLYKDKDETIMVSTGVVKRIEWKSSDVESSISSLLILKNTISRLSDMTIGVNEIDKRIVTSPNNIDTPTYIMTMNDLVVYKSNLMQSLSLAYDFYLKYSLLRLIMQQI